MRYREDYSYWPQHAMSYPPLTSRQKNTTPRSDAVHPEIEAEIARIKADEAERALMEKFWPSSKMKGSVCVVVETTQPISGQGFYDGCVVPDQPQRRNQMSRNGWPLSV